ncbi:MAG: hypothetical protein L3J57_14230 [Desulfuromusa sp.]|nr:hypothetical protein [Desulfuromusa sp.]
MIDRRAVLKGFLSSVLCGALADIEVVQALAGSYRSTQRSGLSPEFHYPQWMFGKTITFKGTGENYRVGCVMKETLLIGRGDGTGLQTVRVVLKKILGRDFRADLDFDKFWECNGLDLSQIRRNTTMGGAE